MLYCKFVKNPHSRSCFAGVKKFCSGALQFTNILRSLSSYTAHSLENIQRETFTLKKGRIACLDLKNNISLYDCVTVIEIWSEHHILLKPVINLFNYFKTGNYSVLLCRHCGYGVH